MAGFGIVIGVLNLGEMGFSEFINIDKICGCLMYRVMKKYYRCLFWLQRYPTTCDSEMGFGTTLSFLFMLPGCGQKNWTQL